MFTPEISVSRPSRMGTRLTNSEGRGLPLFFGVAACSWMPHWACHYYRLETGTSFVVGSWEFTRLDSTASLLVYTILIGINLVAISWLQWRRSAALLSGLLHLAIGSLHV